MNYSFHYRLRPAISRLVISLIVAALPSAVLAQEKSGSKTKAKPAAGKSAAKSPGAATQYDKHLVANMKLLSVLGRYADCLAGATDATTATLALTQLEGITGEAITAGEALVKLGRPAPDMEAKLGQDADLKLTSQLVAEKTRAAVKLISDNGEVKSVLAPGIESFQAALNRIQEVADDPQGPGGPDKKPKPAAAGVPFTPAGPEAAPAKSVDGTAAAEPSAPPQE